MIIFTIESKDMKKARELVADYGADKFIQFRQIMEGSSQSLPPSCEKTEVSD